MEFYGETQLMYLEIDASGTRSGTSCPRDKAADNSILRPITFANKSLSNVERKYSNI